MARSKWKFNFYSNPIWRSLFTKKRRFKRTARILVFTRSTNLTLYFRRAFVFIHKGNLAKRIRFRALMAGYKLGEFAFTKKPFFFPFRRKKRR